jgi:hypothetical protein
MVVQLAVAIARSAHRAIVGTAPSDLRAITTALHAAETAHEVAIEAHAAGHHAEMTAEDVRVSLEMTGLVEPERGAKARHVRIGRPEWSDHATLSAPRVR